VKHRYLDAYDLANAFITVMTLAIAARHGEQLALIIRQQLDDRCVHCGYRKDHPIVEHGPPCLARDDVSRETTGA
jgi:hypothetical protein